MNKGIVVFDLDGTIANINHRLHYIQKEPKDWESFFSKATEDSPNSWAEALIKALDYDGYFIVIVSGRPERTRADTEKWLEQNNIPCHQLFLVRKDGDHAPDDLLKQKWLDAFEQKNDIEFVVDDRQRVVDMWRRNGLVCLQCYAWEETQ